MTLLEHFHLRARRLFALILIITVLAAMGVATAAPTHAAPGTNRLHAGERLSANEHLISPNGNLKLVMQADGNLVLYVPDAQGALTQPRWQTQTAGNAGRGVYVAMQGDGNLVVYTADRDVLWDSFSAGAASGGDFLQLQDDGNLVIYDTANPGAPQSKWQTATKWFPATLAVNSVLRANTALQSPDGRYELRMQGDGNLVFYGPDGWIWQTDTDGSGANRLAVQGDGNLVLRTASDAAIWQSGTYNRVGGDLRVQNDGKVVYYGPGNAVVYSANDATNLVRPAPPTPPSLLQNPHPGRIGANGGFTPRAAWLRDQIKTRFGSDCTSYRAGSSSDHSTGNALDCWGSLNTRRAVANWARDHASTLEVSYVIHEQRIWSLPRSSEGWRWMADRGNPTANHYDHVHISVQNPRAEY